MKICVKCGLEKDHSEFGSYKSKKSSLVSDLRSECKSCYNEYMRAYLKNPKHKQLVSKFDQRRSLCVQKIKLEKGCCLCGYNKNAKALQFHHIDPSDKKVNISACLSANANFLAEEINKCVVLCSNCHAEVEDGLQISNILDFKLNISADLFLKQKENIKINSDAFCTKCQDCGKCVSNKAVFCLVCSKKPNNKVFNGATGGKIPTKEVLESLIWQIPTTHIAKQFGVSDTAVKKWCGKYCITKPPRGYWTKHHECF